MNNFAKVVIIVILVLSFFFIKEKCGSNISTFISTLKNITHIEIPKFDKEKEKNEEHIVKQPTEYINKDNEEIKDKAEIYFLALDDNDNGIFKKVQREVPQDEDKLEFAVKELLKGPNIIEKSTGTYSEIPKTTKFLSIKKKGNKVIIDLNSDFQYGGGTDSVYSRMMQLIKTLLANTDNKNIYLYLDGKQVNFIGGEGIMLSQPLTEKSLEG